MLFRSRPYPYYDEEVKVFNVKGGDTLAGTFTKPNAKGKYPVAILITGSGPEDRNESVFGHKPFLVLADYLTRKGFAVLRCDDRGTAKSTGNFATATSADFATDVEAQIDYLKKRKDVDTKRIGLIGHSEGGVVAPLVASKRNDVAFIVMMAGVGVGMFDNLYIQDSLVAASMGYSKEGLQNYLYQQKTMFGFITSSKDSSTAANKLYQYLSGSGASDQIVNAAIKQLCSPWMRWFIGYDPAEHLKKVQCPVLAINGEKDVQVPAELNITAIEKTLREIGNKNFRTEILPGLNHLFQHCNKCTVSEYREIEETINPEVLKYIGEWLGKYFIDQPHN